MKRIRHSESTFEMREVFVVRRAEGPSQPCEMCAPEINTMVSPEIAASITGIPVRQLFRLLESGLIHYREIEGGAVLICVNSIVRPTNRTD